MRNLFTAYRWLAPIVGVLLAFCSLVALPLKYLAAEGSDLQQFGETASVIWRRPRLGLHGLRRGRVPAGPPGGLEPAVHRGWCSSAGLIPLLIFWVERRVARRLRAEHPELATAGAGATP